MHGAGAQLSGCPQHTIASHFIDRLKKCAPSSQQFRGVVFFCAQAGDLPRNVECEGWYVMDMQKHIMSKSRSPIHESDSFVLFDEARCRCGNLHSAWRIDCSSSNSATSYNMVSCGF
jgi:hypothetical protein